MQGRKLLVEHGCVTLVADRPAEKNEVIRFRMYCTIECSFLVSDHFQKARQKPPPGKWEKHGLDGVFDCTRCRESGCHAEEVIAGPASPAQAGFIIRGSGAFCRAWVCVLTSTDDPTAYRRGVASTPAESRASLTRETSKKRVNTPGLYSSCVCSVRMDESRAGKSTENRLRTLTASLDESNQHDLRHDHRIVNSYGVREVLSAAERSENAQNGTTGCVGVIEQDRYDGTVAQR